MQISDSYFIILRKIKETAVNDGKEGVNWEIDWKVKTKKKEVWVAISHNSGR